MPSKSISPSSSSTSSSFCTSPQQQQQQQPQQSQLTSHTERRAGHFTPNVAPKSDEILHRFTNSSKLISKDFPANSLTSAPSSTESVSPLDALLQLANSTFVSQQAATAGAASAFGAQVATEKSGECAFLDFEWGGYLDVGTRGCL